MWKYFYWLGGGGTRICLIIPPLVERGAIHVLQSPCPSVCPSVHTFVKDVSAATGRNDFIFDTWLWHSDLYHVSPFQAYHTSTSCLPCDLEFFMFAVVKTLYYRCISASTGRNDFIFDIWLWHGDLYRVSPFQVYRTSTSCLQCDLEFFMFAVIAENFRNSYLSFYWKKLFYIWYMALAWWLVTVSPLSRFTAHLLPVYRATYKWTSGGILNTT